MDYEIEHPDITHVNRTGYTKRQWDEMLEDDGNDERDKSELDD